MGNVIKIKHGSTIPKENQLQQYELGYNVTDGLLYIGGESTSSEEDTKSLSYLPLVDGQVKQVINSDTQIKSTLENSSTTTDNSAIYAPNGYVSAKWLHSGAVTTKDEGSVGDASHSDVYTGLKYKFGVFGSDGFLYTLNTAQLDQLLTNKATLILEKAYPVGSIYISYENVNPKNLFGFGTWARIQGRFLYAGTNGQNEGGETGGTANVTLTVDQMPTHTHNTYMKAPTGGVTDATKTSWGFDWVGESQGTGLTQEGTPYYSGIQWTGGGQSHTNMPPYYVVWIWRRTA